MSKNYKVFGNILFRQGEKTNNRILIEWIIEITGIQIKKKPRTSWMRGKIIRFDYVGIVFG